MVIGTEDEGEGLRRDVLILLREPFLNDVAEHGIHDVLDEWSAKCPSTPYDRLDPASRARCRASDRGWAE